MSILELKNENLLIDFNKNAYLRGFKDAELEIKDKETAIKLYELTMLIDFRPYPFEDKNSYKGRNNEQ